MLAILLLQSGATGPSGYSGVVVGGLLSFVGALLVIMLGRVLKQGDDLKLDLKTFGTEQTRQGTSITKIETTLHGDNGLVSKVNRMHDERSRDQAARLQREIMEHAELQAKYDALVEDRGDRRAKE